MGAKVVDDTHLLLDLRLVMFGLSIVGFLDRGTAFLYAKPMFTQRNSQILGASSQSQGWFVAIALIGAVVAAPLFSVLWLALHPTENIWPHLMATVLPRYLATTLTLMLGVGILTAMIGAGAAWLVTMYRFPGRGWLVHGLLFPLALPAYISAYALVDFLDYSGPLQTGLRLGFGWQSAKDYWFPEIRSVWAAILVLSCALYPYVYLLARQALKDQSAGVFEVARALGTGGFSLFWRLGLPLARPAIAAGVAMCLMETVADFGTVSHFGVQTLTTGVFSTWLNGGNAGGAAQLAGVIMALILLLVTLERISRRSARFHRGTKQARPVEPVALSGWRGMAATGLCLLPFAMGFVLPVAVMLRHGLANPSEWLDAGLFAAAKNTLVVGLAAGVLTVGSALILVHGLRSVGQRMRHVILPVTALGYATPGAVLAVGILMPLAAIDHRLADLVTYLTGSDPGLLLTGTSFAIILAVSVRFFGIAQGSVDSAFGRIPPSLPMAARSLGKTNAETLRALILPMIRGSVGVAFLVVFVDCVKELPATLLLRPFNFNTLSTRVYELSSLERLGQAAPAALIVSLFGLAAVALLARSQSQR
jgi:iron(III) transport system permease protein